MKVIEFAAKRLHEEEQDVYGLASYWAAYLDGAHAQRKEDLPALEKQIPKPPLQACGHTTEKWMSYCPFCGQRLDWADHC